jgi:hypothetical protein
MISIDRVKAMLLSPRTEWPKVDAEAGEPAAVIRDYLVWLAAVPAIAAFIGFSIVGFGAFGVTVRMPFFSGLVQAVMTVVLTVVMALVLAKIADLLAPKFGGRSHYPSAFKLIAYGSTAALVAGVVYLLPALSVLGLLGALYTVYLIYLGAPVVMKVPQDKALVYTAVLVVCGFVANIVIGLASAMFMPSMPAPGADLKISTPKGEVAIDTKKLDEFAKKMEQAAKKVEEASKSGDPSAIGKAAGEALGAVAGAAGAGQREPIGAQQLKAILPESIDGLARAQWEASDTTAMGIKGSSAKADYGQGERRIELEILDIGGLSGLMSIAGWMGVTGERETGTERERTYKDGARMVHEREQKSGRRSEYKLVLGNGVVVQAEGDGVDLATLKRAVGGLDLKALESAGKGG